MKILKLLTIIYIMLTAAHIPPVEVKAEEGVAGISVTLDQVKDIDIYPTNDMEALYRIVEAEGTGECIEAKKNIACVIINRVHNKDFPDTITEVVFQKIRGYYQFSPILDKRYWSVEITESTKEAVNEILKNGVNRDALYFFNPDKSTPKMRKWFETRLEYLFADPSGHSFYK